MRFAEIEDDSPRNTAISHESRGDGFWWKWVEFYRSVSFNLETILGQSDWRKKPRGGNPNNDGSCIIDTCFNGGALCSFNWMYRYKNYLRATSPQIPKIHKSVWVKLKFVFRKIKILEILSFLLFYQFAMGINFDRLERDRLAAAPNYFHEWILLGNCVRRLVSDSVTSTMGSANGNWWLGMGGIDGYVLVYQLRAVIQNWKRILRKWEISIYKSYRRNRISWIFWGGSGSFSFKTLTKKE